jgi:hypothetical protein
MFACKGFAPGIEEKGKFPGTITPCALSMLLFSRRTFQFKLRSRKTITKITLEGMTERPPERRRGDLEELVDFLAQSSGGGTASNEDLVQLLRTLHLNVRRDRLEKSREQSQAVTPLRLPHLREGRVVCATLLTPSMASPPPERIEKLRTYPRKQWTREALEESAKHLRSPRQNLGDIYQRRVAGQRLKEDTNVDHIFSSRHAHLRLGFSSVETRTTRKQPALHSPLTTVASAAPSPRAVVGLDVAPIYEKPRTFKAKVRETILFTGKAVQTFDPRSIPTVEERFRVSYNGVRPRSPAKSPRLP